MARSAPPDALSSASAAADSFRDSNTPAMTQAPGARSGARDFVLNSKQSS
jgi:hypothetical protein